MDRGARTTGLGAVLAPANKLVVHSFMTNEPKKAITMSMNNQR